jgi:hypothetical protein
MLQEVHLSSGLLLWLVILYVALSLLSAVVVGRFINLGRGRDRGRASAFRPFINFSPESSNPAGSSSSYEEEPTTT